MSVAPALSRRSVENDDKFFEALERSSRCPSGRQAGRPLIDLEILAGRVGPDEMESEEQSGRHTDPGFLYKKAHPDLAVAEGCCCSDEEDPKAADFRDHIDHVKCRCTNGRTCQLCVTSIDLTTIPSRFVIGSKRLPGVGPVEKFEVELKVSDAIELGLISEDDLPEEPVEE